MTPGLMAQLDVVGSMAVAMVLGGLVGYERELKRRPAGFRTHMLVAGASALLVAIGALTVDMHLSGQSAGVLRVDPLRLVEAVIGGVAFIGAGTIFASRRGEGVAGITTAASLLLVAVIGVAAGFGFHLLALAATLLTLLVLTVLHALDRQAGRDR